MEPSSKIKVSWATKRANTSTNVHQSCALVHGCLYCSVPTADEKSNFFFQTFLKGNQTLVIYWLFRPYAPPRQRGARQKNVLACQRETKGYRAVAGCVSGRMDQTRCFPFVACGLWPVFATRAMHQPRDATPLVPRPLRLYSCRHLVVWPQPPGKFWLSNVP